MSRARKKHEKRAASVDPARGAERRQPPRLPLRTPQEVSKPKIWPLARVRIETTIDSRARSPRSHSELSGSHDQKARNHDQEASSHSRTGIIQSRLFWGFSE